MSRSAAATAAQFSRVDTEAKLALLEFLLTNTDLQASARRAIDWLAAHAGVLQAVVAVAEPGAGPILLVAEHGVSSSADRRFRADPRRRGASAGPCDGERRPDLFRRRVGHVPGAHRGWRVPRGPAPRGGRADGPRPAVGERVGTERPSRRDLDRPDARPAGGEAPEPPDPRRDALRAGTDAALQHHQCGHRPDPAHRSGGQAHHREHARGEALRRARGCQRRLAARGRAEQHAVFGRALDERRRPDGGGAPRAPAGRSARGLRPPVRIAELPREGRAAGHLRRLGAAQRDRPGAREGRDRGELPDAAARAGGSPRRAPPAGSHHRLGGRSDPGHRPGRGHRADERAGRAALRRAAVRRERRRSGGCTPTART